MIPVVPAKAGLVIASVAKQPRAAPHRAGLLRYARNDEGAVKAA
jgi:hypothetical protein